MMNFVKVFCQLAKQAPQRPAIGSGSGSLLTYRHLDEFSGRVYHYLKEHGIGREDVVCILLPRGVESFIAMMGVWKAGAAFVALEEGYPAERVAFIQKDCGCRLVIDFAVWQEIQCLEPLSGFESVEDHDAAFAVYTSGSTGNPKGVMHEYGNIDRIAASQIVRLERFGLIAPVNFVAAVIAFISAVSYGAVFFVIPFSVVKNPTALVRCFSENNITETFCAPSVYRLFRQIPSLRTIILSSEPAYGIWSEDPAVAIYNFYAMSEGGIIAAMARLDAPNETAPIGRPGFELGFCLRDEEGRVVPDGEAGEICYDNPYVRGYINLQEQTARSFVDGEYRTGDLGRRLENGDYVVLGRIDDMLKINGNRVEPAEVENAARHLLGLREVIVRGFIEGESAFLCLYYTDDVALDEMAAREVLLSVLPYYMVPAYFTHLDSLPRTQSGKLSRRLLPRPEIGEQETAYSAPVSDEERALCEAMAAVLRLPRVGAEDDFYSLGGSSISSMELVAQCSLPELNAAQIFRGRTPRRIAELYLAEADPDSAASGKDRIAAAMSQPWPLTEEQRYMFDYQLYTPKSTMRNIAGLLRINGETDAGRFCAAVNAMIQSHPALMTTLSFNDDGELVQRYTPELIMPTRIEDITEEALEAEKDRLVQPYKLIGQPLMRSRIFRTEQGLYWFYDIHHMLFDGSSGKIMLQDVCEKYLAEEWPKPSEPDGYFLMLQERLNHTRSPMYAESRDYFEQRYGGVDWSVRLDCEQDTRMNRYGDCELPLDLPEGALKELEEKTGLGKNGFFMVAELLGLAALNGKKNVLVPWVYKGRDSKYLKNILGLLFRELPVAVSLTSETTLKTLFADVQEQIRAGIAHSDYPYIDKDAIVKTNDHFIFIYQEDNWNVLGEMPLDMEEVDIDFSEDASQTAMDVQILDTEDGLLMLLDYSRDRYLEADVLHFMDTMRRLIDEMLNCRDRLEITIGELFAALSLPFPQRE